MLYLGVEFNPVGFPDLGDNTLLQSHDLFRSSRAALIHDDERLFFVDLGAAVHSTPETEAVD